VLQSIPHPLGAGQRDPHLGFDGPSATGIAIERPLPGVVLRSLPQGWHSK